MQVVQSDRLAVTCPLTIHGVQARNRVVVDENESRNCVEWFSGGENTEVTFEGVR